MRPCCWVPNPSRAARELEAYRTAGDMVTRALTAACESLLTGQSSAEAAAVAASHPDACRRRLSSHRYSSRADTEHRVISGDLYGYHTTPPRARRRGPRLDYGTHFPGLLDGPRPLIDLRQPPDQSSQRALLEGAVEVVDAVVAAMRPGITPRQLGVLGGAIARKHGYFDHPQLKVPLLGHGLGTNFIPYVIPIGEVGADPDGELRYDVPLEAGMVMAAEIFLTHPGVGTAGFEQNLIVTTGGPDFSPAHRCSSGDSAAAARAALRLAGVPRVCKCAVHYRHARHAHHAGDARRLGATEVDSHSAWDRRRNRARRSRARFAVRLVLATALALAPGGAAFDIGGNRRQCRLRDREGLHRCLCTARPGWACREDFCRPCIQRYWPIRDRRDASLP